MANTNPIETKTKLKKINLKDPDMEKKIRQECDDMGAGGYELKAAFETDATLVLIFQLTR